MKMLLLAITASLASMPVIGAEPLDAKSLQSYCEDVRSSPETAEAKLCLVYVTGFVDGAVTTDERVTRNVVDQVEERETFLDRAMRTRILRQLRDYGPSYYAEFCVGSAVSIASVASLVADEFGHFDSLDGIAAQTVVFSALRRHYPCETLPT